MKACEDYKDTFTPVPHSTVVRIIISMAAGLGWELRWCNLAQAFIQADKLQEGVNSLIFICPLAGAEEDNKVVYEVRHPL